MHVSTLPRTLVSSGALAVLTAAGALGQTGAGAIGGTVYDSITQAPLADAAVFLWNTSHRAVTDAEGRFLIGGVPAGSYTLLFFHTLLGERGISPGPQSVRVAGADTVLVELATPSAFTMKVAECLLEETPAQTGVVAGWVVDGETGTGLPRARVTLSWSVRESPEPERLHLDSDEEGWYRTCRAPTGIPLVAAATFFDRQGLRRELVVPEGGSAEVDFLVWRMKPAEVAGHVEDAATGERVSDAEVWLRGTSFRTVTGPTGEFRLGDVPPGSYTMFMRHLQYGTKQDTLIVTAGARVAVDMRVDAQAIEIEPLTVTVEPEPISGRASGGYTVTRAEIDEVRGRVRDVGDILLTRQVPGVIVRRRGDNDSLCVGFTSGQVRMLGNTAGGCAPMLIFINDVRATNTELALQMPPESIDRIVVYRPLEAGALFGGGSGSGVLVIYTRSR